MSACGSDRASVCVHVVARIISLVATRNKLLCFYLDTPAAPPLFSLTSQCTSALLKTCCVYISILSPLTSLISQCTSALLKTCCVYISILSPITPLISRVLLHSCTISQESARHAHHLQDPVAVERRGDSRARSNTRQRWHCSDWCSRTCRVAETTRTSN
jgi:hypothetical protein